MDLSLTSPAFEDGQPIPQKYTCWGDNANPPLKIDNIPTGTQSLALIMDDPDAPSGTWVHWLVWNMDPGTTDIKEDHYFINEGKNSWYESKYGGPCPPSGTHRYFFKLYALDEQLNLPSGTQKKHLEGAMKGHILGQGELIGTVSK
ncbi:MAG: YbhB/YbcL family Raf kinase inhibitor-like protein [Nanoarchaeota archaeon]|nr:YbhB/YbcL family Raf kinase inhibitor-like protein [Nanoarchaeota archaeon]